LHRFSCRRHRGLGIGEPAHFIKALLDDLVLPR
jgi:hypothetical protein